MSLKGGTSGTKFNANVDTDGAGNYYGMTHLNGPSSSNVSMGAKHWENPYLGYFHINGGADRTVVGLEANGNDYGLFQ